jgi:hypothetical protein
MTSDAIVRSHAGSNAQEFHQHKSTKRVTMKDDANNQQPTTNNNIATQRLNTKTACCISPPLMKSVISLLCIAVLSAPSAVAHSSTSSPGWGLSREILVLRGGSVSAAPDVSTKASEARTNNARTTTTPPSQTSNYTFSLLQPGDGHEDDPDGIPGRYLRMQKGNRKKALVALQESLEWRAELEVDTILARPHPKFDLCNAVLPRSFIGRDATGHVIHCLQPGFLNMRDEVPIDALVTHCVYVLEYCWNVIEPRPDETMTSIIDLNGLSFTKTKKLWNFVQQFAMMLSHNYPQRSYKTLVINAPGWFGALFRIISPLLRESTRDKISLLAKGSRQEQVLKEVLGVEFAAQVLSGEKIEASPLEEEMQTHVSCCVL